MFNVFFCFFFIIGYDIDFNCHSDFFSCYCTHIIHLKEKNVLIIIIIINYIKYNYHYLYIYIYIYICMYIVSFNRCIYAKKLTNENNRSNQENKSDVTCGDPCSEFVLCI